MGTEYRETFTLAMSSEYHHENRQHPMSRATNLIKLFGRLPSSSPNHLCTQNTPSFLVDLNREVSMSHNSNHKSSVSSRAASCKDINHKNPTAAPKGPRPPKTPKEGQPPLLRRMASLSQDSPKRETFELELRPRKSMEDIRNFDRPPQNRTNTNFAWPFQKAGSPNSKVASQPPPRKNSSNSLPEGAPKFRVVGRGGSGSQLRKVSISSSGAGPDVPRPHQPPKVEFYRPTGRGGIGSSTKPLALSKPAISVLGLLNGRGRIQKAQRNGQCKSQEVPPHTRTQSLSSNLDYRPPNEDLIITSGYSQVSLNDGLFTLSPSADSSSEGLCSISRNSDLDDDGSTNSYFEGSMRPIPTEHHQHSLDKLSRTLGMLSAPLMDGLKPVSKSSTTFNKPPRKYSETLLTNLGNKFIGPRSSRRSSMFVDDLHQFDSADDLANLDDGSSVEDDTPHSPITFAPVSLPKGTSQPLPPSDTDSSLTTPSQTGESNPAFPYTPTEPSLPIPPATHLHVPSHSTVHSAFLDDDLPRDPNGLPIKANWLVPLGRHNDDVVISFTRDAPANHPQSWMGEWNNDMQDVIEGLRRL